MGTGPTRSNVDDRPAAWSVVLVGIRRILLYDHRALEAIHDLARELIALVGPTVVHPIEGVTICREVDILFGPVVEGVALIGL